MINLIGTDISNELLVVYSLIGFVIVLIIIIFIVDYMGRKKKNNMFDSKKLSKRLKELQVESANTEVKVPIVNQQIVPIEPVKMEEVYIDKTDDIYIESDLEKTQAQIELEQITLALSKAKEEEKKDPYETFEIEQEQSAIISYEELKEKFEQLYDENEKVQYLDDDKIPININELLETKEKAFNKVTLDDMKTVFTPKETVVSGFKSSPVISPVYGIQKEPATSSSNNLVEIDEEIRKTNEFLKTLKELQKNLD